MDLSKREKIGIIIFTVIIVFILSFNFYSKSNGSMKVISNNTENSASEINKSETKSNKSIPKNITIYVCGEVKNPGIYNLVEGDRIDAAINAAGGFTAKADKLLINLASKLKDEEQIIVMSKGSANIQTQGSAIINLSVNSNSNSKKININTANKEELMKLPRVGDALSDRIIEYREKNGQFKSINDLDNVSGIGPKMLENIKDLVSVN